MAYTATPDDILKVRIELQDNEPGLYILDDESITYFLNKNNGSIGKSCIDAAKTILFKLSQESDETVGIFSLCGRAAADSYRQALELYIKNVSLNPLYTNAGAYAGGISVTDAASYQTLDSTIRTFEF